MQRVKKRLGVGLLSLMGMACTDADIEWSGFQSVDPQGWSLDSTLVLNVEPEEVNRGYALEMAVRHTVDYPYSNLFVFRNIILEQDTLYSDTLELSLADEYGEWNGKGSGLVREMVFPYRQNLLRFEESGAYRFTFAHGMRDTQLTGIERIGLRLIRIEEDSTHRP